VLLGDTVGDGGDPEWVVHTVIATARWPCFGDHPRGRPIAGMTADLFRAI
jgi:hypothetical protein